MIVDLMPEEILRIDNKDYIVQADPEMKNKPYIQDGSIGQVVQLVQAEKKDYYALKIFKKSTPNIIDSAERINKNNVSKIPGFVAAKRKVITPQSTVYKELLKKHSYLEYAILMPWMGGYTWIEILGDNYNDSKQKILELTSDSAVFFASMISRSLSSLEERGFAHCDLCSNNVVIDIKDSNIHLIDIEEMYFPDTSRPNGFIGGQSGYRHPKHKGHQWVKESDRFGGGILISEILSWHNPIIRKLSDSESYFDQSEICNDTEKYRVMLRTLDEQGGRNLSQIYKELWNSKNLEDCPKLSDWDVELQKILKDRNILQPDFAKDTQFGLDGRIKIGRRHVRILDEIVPPSGGTINRKQVTVVAPQKQSAPLPDFQPTTDWGKLILWLIVLIVIALICLAISAALGSALYTTTPSSVNNFTQESALPMVVIASKTLKPNIAKPSKTPAATPTPTPFPDEYTDDFGVSMRLISDGEFAMGSNSGFEDEQPLHTVYLDSYYIDKYEVTNVLYEACVKDEVCDPPQNFGSGTRSSYYGDSQYSDYPVIYVDWHQAKTYCEWRGARLPIEAEWEKAARGVNEYKYPWGNNFECRYGNFDDIQGFNGSLIPGSPNCDGYNDTTPVGSFGSGRSPFGIYDMAGNVWEWVSDWYDGNYYLNSSYQNPQGPSSGNERVIRGGAWDVANKDNLLTTRRIGFEPLTADNYLGFRCASSLP